MLIKVNSTYQVYFKGMAKGKPYYGKEKKQRNFGAHETVMCQIKAIVQLI